VIIFSLFRRPAGKGLFKGVGLIMMAKFNHVAIYNRSAEEARQFYGELLGLTESYHFELAKELAEKIFDVSQALEVLVFTSDTLKLEVFVSGEEVPVATAINHICLEVEERPEFIRRCRSLGLEVREILREHGVTIFVKDFYGNLLEIKELPADDA